MNTAGVRTTFGSLHHDENVPQEDAVCAARVKSAGAILFGKTTTPEFGHKALTDAPLFGRTRNAWSAERTSGGSSGGAAVAVAAGIGPIGIATDGGGSTRIPAAANGVVGLKQSNGVIPHSQVADAFGNYTYVTPMTRTVMDTALMLQAMAGPHPSDPWSIGVAPQDYIAAARAEGDLSGKRILYSLTLGNTVVAKDVRDRVRTRARQAARTRRRAGRARRDAARHGADLEGHQPHDLAGALRRPDPPRGQSALPVAGAPGRHGVGVDAAPTTSAPCSSAPTSSAWCSAGSRRPTIW